MCPFGLNFGDKSMAFRPIITNPQNLPQKPKNDAKVFVLSILYTFLGGKCPRTG
jgi:hypothetical protein